MVSIFKDPPGALHAERAYAAVPNQKDEGTIVTGRIDGARLMDGTIFDSKGHRIAVVVGSSIFVLNGQKLYDLKTTNVNKLSCELVGHIPLDGRSFERPLDKSADKLFR